jgi:hypothetical protein
MPRAACVSAQRGVSASRITTNFLFVFHAPGLTAPCVKLAVSFIVEIGKFQFVIVLKMCLATILLADVTDCRGQIQTFVAFLVEVCAELRFGPSMGKETLLGQARELVIFAVNVMFAAELVITFCASPKLTFTVMTGPAKGHFVFVFNALKARPARFESRGLAVGNKCSV